MDSPFARRFQYAFADYCATSTKPTRACFEAKQKKTSFPTCAVRNANSSHQRIFNKNLHVVEAIAHDNKRQLILQLHFLQIILDALRFVAVAFAANALDFLDLAGTARSLNVFEVHFGILRKIDDSTEEIVQAFVRLERLEQFDTFVRAELLVIFRANLDDHLQILSNVLLQHGPATLQRIFGRQSAKVQNEPLGVE